MELRDADIATNKYWSNAQGWHIITKTKNPDFQWLFMTKMETIHYTISVNLVQIREFLKAEYWFHPDLPRANITP